MRPTRATTVGLVGFLAAGMLVGWWLSPVRHEEPIRGVAARDPWALQPLPRVVLGTAGTVTAVKALNAPYWGVQNDKPVTAAPAPPPEDLRWRVAAIVGAGSQRKVLVVYRANTRPTQLVGINEKLPSGHQIVGIEENSYCVSINGAAYRLGVERSD